MTAVQAATPEEVQKTIKTLDQKIIFGVLSEADVVHYRDVVVQYGGLLILTRVSYNPTQKDGLVIGLDVESGSELGGCMLTDRDLDGTITNDEVTFLLILSGADCLKAFNSFMGAQLFYDLAIEEALKQASYDEMMRKAVPK